jgi:Ricin-type beta-trefoil lectin domain-like
MMRNYFTLARLLEGGWMPAVFTLLSLMMLSPQPASANNIGSVSVVQNQCGKVTVSISLNSGWQVMPKNNKPTYIVSTIVNRREIGTVKTSNNPLIPIEWPQGEGFSFIVEARSRQTGNFGITMYRKVNEVEGISATCSSYVPAPGEVRLRHEQTGKCMFGDLNDGGPAATFTCWKDPNMGYLLDSISGNEVRIRHRSTGKCLYGDTANGGVAKNWTCWNDPNMVWIKDALPGTNRFRLRHKATGRCIYGGSSDAAAVRAWGPCWDDPAMVWVVEPF